MKKLAALIVVLISLVSCHPEGRVYIEHQDLSPNIEWLKADIKEFKVPVENIEQAYNMSLSFRFTTGFQYKFAKLKLTEVSPSGEITLNDFSLKVREDNGDYVGDPGLDIWDSEHVVQSNKKFTEKGIHTFKLEHIMPVDPLNFAMEVGVILDEVK